MVNDHDSITRRSFLKRACVFIVSLLVFGALSERCSSAKENAAPAMNSLKEAKYYEQI